MAESAVANGVNGASETKEVNGDYRVGTRPRMGSRSLPFLSDLLGNSLNDRLLFAVPKSLSCSYSPVNSH
jgi:ATP phosphoribosyltransferase